MKERLLQLVNIVLSNTNLDDLPACLKLFDPFKDLFDNSLKIPPEVNQQWDILNALWQLLNQWEALNNQLQSNHHFASARHEIANKIKNKEATKQDNAKALAEKQKTLATSYDEVYKVYRQTQCTVDQLTAISSPTSPEDRYKLVVDLFNQLTEQRNQLKNSQDRLILNENINQRKRCIEKLKEMNLWVTLSPAELREGYQTQHNALQKIKQTADELSKQLSLINSKPDAEAPIRDANIKLTHSINKLANIEQAIKDSPLDPETKKLLINEYNDAKDKAAYLANKLNHYNFASVWYNPVHIFRTTVYGSVNQTVLNDASIFVKLLHKQTTRKIKIASFKTNIEYLTKLDKVTDTISPQTTCEAAASFLKVQSTDPAELLTLMINKCLEVSESVNFYETALKLINEILRIDEQNVEHLTLSDIGSDALSSAQNLETLKKLAKDNEEQVKVLQGHIDTCKVYIEIASEINSQTKLLAEQNQELSDLLTIHGQLDSKLAQANYPEKQTNELKQLAQQIAAKLPVLEQIQQETAATIEESGITSVNSEFHMELNKQHLSIKALYSRLPADLQQWYDDLYIALLSQVNEQNTFYQAAQLLHDIHFELQYPDKSGQYKVLLAYRKNCPKPQTDIRFLLSMKLAIPVETMEVVSTLANEKLQNKLNTIYRHEEKLKEKYPREALLLEQAATNLKLLIIQADEDSQKPINKEVLHNLLEDPRYESLHEHRGMLKAVELLAQACTALLSWFNYAPTNYSNYRQRFFYVPTQSLQLLEAATEEICTAA